MERDSVDWRHRYKAQIVNRTMPSLLRDLGGAAHWVGPGTVSRLQPRRGTQTAWRRQRATRLHPPYRTLAGENVPVARCISRA